MNVEGMILDQYATNKVFQILKEIKEALGDDAVAVEQALAITGVRALGVALEKAIERGGEEAGREALSAFVTDLARNMTRGGREVRVFTEWKGEEA